jgi:chemotaxis signal transduction protein
MSPPPEYQHVDAYRSVSGLTSLTTRHLEQMSDEDFWELARLRASALPGLPSHEEYLECALAHGTCLIPLTYLAEAVSPPHRLSVLPVTPAWMHGISAWKGDVIAVIDLNMYLFEREECTSLSEGMLLVTALEETILGLLVPAIGMTTMITAEQVSQPTNPPSLPQPHFMKGVYNEQPIIDIPALFREAVQQIGTIASHG